MWLPLNVISNGNASSSSQAVGVTKIAKSVIAPLAQQHVSVFMLSTYQTDFILVSPQTVAVIPTSLYLGLIGLADTIYLLFFYNIMGLNVQTEILFCYTLLNMALVSNRDSC